MKQEEKQYCFGCGAELQSDNPLESGYVPKEVLDTKKASLCQRCFRLQNYGEEAHIFPASQDFHSIITSAKRKKALIVYVVDFFSYDFSLFEEYREELQGLDIFLVGNKRDILPKSLNDHVLITRIHYYASKYGVSIVDTLLTSASKNYNIDDFKAKIEELRKGKDVYVIGAVSAGKSSLINTLLKNYHNPTNLYITTSPYPGTTLNVIRVPLDMRSAIYDTPGYPVPGSMIEIVDRKCIKDIVPQKEMKPRMYQLMSKQTLLIGGLARFEYVDGPKNNFAVYASTMVTVQRSKLEKSEGAFFALIKHHQIHPCATKFMQKEAFNIEEFELTPGKYEIQIVGYAWIMFEAKEKGLYRVSKPKEVHVHVIQRGKEQ